jgi:uncharacterized OB-fold protein
MEMWKCHTEHMQLPVPDEDSLVFWEACRRQRLVIQQCVACQHYRFPPSSLCPLCLSPRFIWREDPGEGEVETFCVYYAALAGPAWQSELPYVVAVIRLWHTKVLILSRLLCDDPHAISIGLPVRVHFKPVCEQVTLPAFVPIACVDSGGAICQ